MVSLNWIELVIVTLNFVFWVAVIVVVVRVSRAVRHARAATELMEENRRLRAEVADLKGEKRQPEPEL